MVIDELMPRLIHCCYADKWPQQVGGVAAVSLVIQKLPVTWLQNHIADAVKAALSVLKHLPTHAALERTKVLKALTSIMQLACPKVRRVSHTYVLLSPLIVIETHRISFSVALFSSFHLFHLMIVH